MIAGEWFAEQINKQKFEKAVSLYEKDLTNAIKALIRKNRELKIANKKLELAYSYLPKRTIKRIEKRVVMLNDSE